MPPELQTMIGSRTLHSAKQWAKVFELLLETEKLRAGMTEGRYDEELRKILKKRELRDVFHGYVHHRPAMLAAMAGRDAELARLVLGDEGWRMCSITTYSRAPWPWAG